LSLVSGSRLDPGQNLSRRAGGISGQHLKSFYFCLKTPFSEATFSFIPAFINLKSARLLIMNTSELVKEAKQGSTAAQKCLFDQFAEKMLLVCQRYVKSPEDAEELLLDGFYKFFTKISSFNYQGDAALYAWLKRIMINECLMFLRAKNVFTIVTDATAEEIPLQEEALDNLSAEEIFKLIVQLPVGYRTVFNLYAIEGMNHGEIAEMLNISEGTSRSQFSKAKVLLRKLLLQKDIKYVKRKSK
jgi:RNA polymerase sigma-70 factor (ECF subfamily)